VIHSRDIKDLEPVFAAKVTQWLAACKKWGVDVIIVSTYRDNEFQDYLYAKGRKNKEAIVTNARGGESKHNFRLAVDFCVMDGKKCNWNDTKRYTQAGLIAESLGLKWAGRWGGKLKEVGHIEA
jgi:peptidoglycan LD-endopeptidase CwlK